MNSLDVTEYFATLAALPGRVEISDCAGAAVDLSDFYAKVIAWCRQTHDSGNTIHLVGNGGSAAIASHMATDFCKNGGLRARAHNDASMLTCLANDYAYEEVFSRQLAMHARPGDLVLAISSSGKSKSILNAVKAARAQRCRVVTLSGFHADNPLRELGDLNAFAPAAEYGFVEIAHLTLVHAMVDLANGWSAWPANERTVPSRAVTVATLEA